MRGPYVTLTPISKSHPFEDRKVKVGTEEEPLKIGRAVARLKPNADNAIFDCKVLSRNHAVMWFKEGEFFLKDTKSSNGTFVNNERLAVTGEESRPKQIYTGDIIQLGVEIVENANKVAHGCIYAMVELFDTEGNALTTVREVTKTPGSEKLAAAGFCSSMVNSHQMFQLQQFLTDASFREEQRQKKIKDLEETVEYMENALHATRKAAVDEDRLLSRIEILEAQLAAASKGIAGDKIKEDMQTFLEDKMKFELMTRDVIKRAQEERAEAELRLADIDHSLVSTEEECNRLRQKLNETDARLSTIVEQFDEKLAELNSLNGKVAESERSVVAAEQRAKEAEERADGAIVDRECDRALPILVLHLTEALRVEDWPAHEAKLTRLVELLKELGIGQTPEPETIPEAPQHKEEPPMEVETSPEVSVPCSTCESLKEKNSGTAEELEASLKENLQLKAVVRDLETKLALVNDSSGLREERPSLEMVSAPSISSSPSKEAVKVTIDPLLASVALFSLVPCLALFLAILLPLNSRFASKKFD